MKVKFDKEKAKEWGIKCWGFLGRPEVLAGSFFILGCAVTDLIYSAVDGYKRATISPDAEKALRLAIDIWNDMPVGIGYQVYKIIPETDNKLHNPLFFLISEEDKETRDFTK